MKKNIIHIGLDVDDNQYHGSALNKITGEVLDYIKNSAASGPSFKTDPTV